MAEEYIIGNDAQFNENVDILGKLNLFDDTNTKNIKISGTADLTDAVLTGQLTASSGSFSGIVTSTKLDTKNITAIGGNFTGIVTATKFSGPLDGITGNFTGTVTATGLDINGNADVSGNLKIGGVVTYEDVTNVDSVGIITSGHGLRVTKGGINVNAGISTFNGAVTATSFSGVGAFVSGMIVLWSGAANAIPTGFVLCDGNNNTPNLTDKFVVGAGSGYAVNATGGYANATLPYHYHNFPGDDQLTYGNGVAGWVSSHDGGFNYDATSTLSGGGKLWRTTAVGESAVDKNLPPYYALCYIMKT